MPASLTLIGSVMHDVGAVLAPPVGAGAYKDGGRCKRWPYKRRCDSEAKSW